MSVSASHSLFTKNKNKGRVTKEETKLKISKSLTGFRHSLDTKRKVSESSKINSKGELNGMSKLTENDVIKIRQLWETGLYLQKEIASVFKISRSHVSSVVNNKKWK